MTADDVRRTALPLPRTTEALVRNQVEFRIGYLALSADETRMGYAYPEDERAALIASDPDNS